MNILLILLLSVSLLASPFEEAKELLHKGQDTHSPLQRLDLYSRAFLGLPYGDGGPLGEGEDGRYDQDPLYRFDTFDCTTYVETVLALALSRHISEFETRMDEVRYENGEVDYLKRNHFPSLQWIPFNVQNGYLREINSLVLPESEQKVAEAVINLPDWLKNIKLEEIRVPHATREERTFLLEELQSRSANYVPMLARLNYLPISTLLAQPALLKKIPHGSIVNFVRPNWDLTDLIGTHMNVSHQGFVFKKKDGVYLRHASSSGEKKVMEVLLLEYLKKFENHATMKGIHLMQMKL